jgi:predicted lactoylglutathione lyase
MEAPMVDNPAARRSQWSIAPYLIVDDVVATANYYRDSLGFEYERMWGEPPSFCMVSRNGVVIMLSQLERTGMMRPNRVVDPEGERGMPTSGSTMLTRSTPSSRRRE